jgi:hypothetical protein
MIVRFPAYRRFSEARIEANDAMMALLIGARLGRHALETSAASPEALLPSLFGQICGIGRLNRTAGDSARLLAGAERHLAYMAIPYALAVHGSFMVAAAQMVRDDGRDPVTNRYALPHHEDPTKLSLEIAHEYITERCGVKLDGTLLPLFHIARRIRNRIIHFAGVPGSRLATEYRSLSSEARDSWEHLAGRPLLDALGSKRLTLCDGELIAVLGVSRNLVQEINDLLAQTLSRAYWASLAVGDYRENHPERFGERDRQLRRVRGYAQHFYKPLRLTDDELATAIGEGGSSY